MKKNYLYTLLIVAFAATIGIVIFAYTSKKEKTSNIHYALIDRRGSAAQTEEWNATRLNAARLLAAVQNDPQDVKSMNLLAQVYIQEARITGNYTYYDKAALKYVDDALKVDSVNFESLLLKSLLYLSQHHFAEGLDIANRAVAINPYNSYIYGVITDGNVEMGKYEAAVESAQKMVDIRPDLRSFTRVSYLREIHGDYEGAIKAMEMAIESGVPGDENTAWTRIQLAHLYEKTGDLQKATFQYEYALSERPDYAFAIAGLGRIAHANKEYEIAIAHYTKANELMDNISFEDELAEVYMASGNEQKAKQIWKYQIDKMAEASEAAQNDESIGHYADLELAYAWLKVNDADKALKHALQEYNRRPNNIDVNECVGWCYYNKGEFSKAVPYMQKALQTGSKNPQLLCRAGLVSYKTGQQDLGKQMIQEALASKAILNADLTKACMQVIQ